MPRTAVLIAAVAIVVCVCNAQVLTGLDRIDSCRDLIAHKRVGVITNHTAVNRQGRHILEVLAHMDAVKVAAVFSPEHGLTGTAEAGVLIDDPNGTTVPIYSLYGQTRKPTAAMLAAVDVLVFDIQDVGARFYTYQTTMALAMQAAAENGKPFIVLDRPNPIGGLDVEGPILQQPFASFIGRFPIPVRHGLTMGELARLINDQGWLSTHLDSPLLPADPNAPNLRADLTVVAMTGWTRAMWYDETGLAFIGPSPNIPSLDTAAVYPGLCLLEGTNVSEGRGTSAPFLQFAAPWIDGPTLTAELNGLAMPGVVFRSVEFTPTDSKHKGLPCRGARILVTDRRAIGPFWMGVEIVDTIRRMYPQQFQFRAEHFDRLCGTDAIRAALTDGVSVHEMRTRYTKDLAAYNSLRRRYLLY